jgi:hypothetical protein
MARGGIGERYNKMCGAGRRGRLPAGLESEVVQLYSIDDRLNCRL